MIGRLMRSLGRLMFRWADKIDPDDVTTALERCYRDALHSGTGVVKVTTIDNIYAPPSTVSEALREAKAAKRDDFADALKAEHAARLLSEGAISQTQHDRMVGARVSDTAPADDVSEEAGARG